MQVLEHLLPLGASDSSVLACGGRLAAALRVCAAASGTRQGAAACRLAAAKHCCFQLPQLQALQGSAAGGELVPQPQQARQQWGGRVKGCAWCWQCCRARVRTSTCATHSLQRV